MDESNEPGPEKTLPFNNLLLASGLVNGLNKGWMYLFTILLSLFGYFSFQFIALRYNITLLFNNGYSEKDFLQNPALLFDYKALGIDRNYVFLMELGMFVFGFAGLYAGIRYIHQKSLRSVITGFEKFRFKRLFFAFFVWTILVLLETLGEYLITPGNFEMKINPMGLIASAVIALLFLPLQSGFEELLFRGYAMQGLAQVTNNGLTPLLFTSVLFGSAHLGNPEVEQYGILIMFCYYSSFGLFLGLLTLLDEGLELAMGIHIANNIAGCLLVSDNNSVISSYSVLQSKTINPFLEMAAWLLMASLCFIVFRLKYRWNNYKLILK